MDLLIFVQALCSCFFIDCILRLLFTLYPYTIGRMFFSKRKNLRQAGSWAIITGASDGIGKAYAEELASDGLNIMLISRTESKLRAVADELENRYKVRTMYVVADFTKSDIYEEIEQKLDSISSIACLVNNVGMVNPYPEYFATSSVMKCDNIWNIIACNCLSQASMTRILLPRLVKQNSGAAIINLSSYSSFTPIPLITLYSASKAFNAQLSESIALECNGANILFQTLCPMLISTSMCRFHKGFFILEPRDFVSSALDMLGVQQFCCGHIRHALELWLYSITPQYFINRLMWKRYKRCLGKPR